MAEWIRYGILAFFGLSSGAVISGGVFAFISMVGIIPRLTGRTRTSRHIRSYENMVVLGGTVGNVVYLYANDMQAFFLRMGQTEIMDRMGLWYLAGNLILILYGIGAGIFVGCLSMALAEGLKVIPIMIGRIRLQLGLPYVILAAALGKFVGALFYAAV